MVDELIGHVVRVHVNLTTGQFVICHPKTGKMIVRVTDVVLRDVTFKVSEKQRQWVIAHQMRQVHAWAFGTLVSANADPVVEDWEAITYNPFRCGDFTTRSGEIITEAKEVAFVDRLGWRPPR